MKPLIAGIDPGTTSAYAILDTSGNVLRVDSSRSWDLATMINKIIELGNPLIVGCDKNPAPKFVEKLSVKVGAKLVAPEEDLLIAEKKELAAGDFDNDHEMDALASAFHAYNEYKDLFIKVDSSVDEELRENVKYLVVKHGLSISKAVEELTKEPEREEPEPEEKVRVVRPTKELEDLKKELALKEKRNEDLREELNWLRRENEKLKKRIKGMPVDQVVKEKEDTIRKLGDKNEKKEERIKRLEQEIQDLKDFVSKSSDKVVVKKLKNLSRKEWNDKSWNLNKGDLVLVEDPNVASQEVLQEMKGKAEVVIHKNKLSVNHGFTYVNAKDLEIEERDDFALVSEDSLKKSLAKKDVLKKVVLDYKKQRA